MTTLYIVSTPIGNLEDISERALRILSEVDLILCEDTRVTKKLLSHYRIETKTLSYHQHSKFQKIDYIIELLRENKKLALVSDAGAPGISDPGNNLIKKLVEVQIPLLKIVPIPGPSAVTAAASVSGFPMDRFIFLGFPPTKKKRKKFFEEVISSKYPIIFYESPHRILKTLNELSQMFQASGFKFQVPEPPKEAKDQEETKSLRLVVCRELTKKFETIYRGNIEETIGQLEKDQIKGEFVVIVESKK